MKSGLYLALRALAKNHAGGLRKPADLLVVLNEELFGPHSRQFMESFAANARLCLVEEPARAGPGTCVTARKCVTQMRLHARGRGGARRRGASAGAQCDPGARAADSDSGRIHRLRARHHHQCRDHFRRDHAQGSSLVARRIADIRIAMFKGWSELESSIDALSAHDPCIALSVEVNLNRGPMEKTDARDALPQEMTLHANAVGIQIDEAPITGRVRDGNFIAALGVRVVGARTPAVMARPPAANISKSTRRKPGFRSGKDC